MVVPNQEPISSNLTGKSVFTHSLVFRLEVQLSTQSLKQLGYIEIANNITNHFTEMSKSSNKPSRGLGSMVFKENSFGRVVMGLGSKIKVRNYLGHVVLTIRESRLLNHQQHILHNSTNETYQKLHH